MGRLLVQEAKDSHAVGRSDVHLPIGNHGRNELIVGKMVATVRRLIAVVQLGRDVGCVVGMQDPGAILVLNRPHDAILCPVRFHARSCTRSEPSAAFAPPLALPHNCTLPLSFRAFSGTLYSLCTWLGLYTSHAHRILCQTGLLFGQLHSSHGRQPQHLHGEHLQRQTMMRLASQRPVLL